MGYLRLVYLAWQNRGLLGRALVGALALVLVVPMLLVGAVVAALGPELVAAGADSGSSPPLRAWDVTQRYGCTGFGLEPARGACPHFHAGIDLAAPAGAPVFSMRPGVVEVRGATGFGGGYGVHVLVHHAEGVETLYAHLSALRAVDGETVPAGAAIGVVGSTGLSTGPHVHLEVRVRGVAIDPQEMFPALFAVDAWSEGSGSPGTTRGTTAVK